jgi:hypothetical protein
MVGRRGIRNSRTHARPHRRWYADCSSLDAEARNQDVRRRLMKNKGALIAASVAGLFGAAVAGSARGADEPQQMADQQVLCQGINSCKGQSACAGAGHACAGKNGCKGQGAMKTSAKDCQAKGGTVSPAKPGEKK